MGHMTLTASFLGTFEIKHSVSEPVLMGHLSKAANFRISHGDPLTLLHSERQKLHTILAFLSAIGKKQV